MTDSEATNPFEKRCGPIHAPAVVPRAAVMHRDTKSQLERWADQMTKAIEDDEALKAKRAKEAADRALVERVLKTPMHAIVPAPPRPTTLIPVASAGVGRQTCTGCRLETKEPWRLSWGPEWYCGSESFFCYPCAMDVKANPEIHFDELAKRRDWERRERAAKVVGNQMMSAPERGMARCDACSAEARPPYRVKIGNHDWLAMFFCRECATDSINDPQMQFGAMKKRREIERAGLAPDAPPKTHVPNLVRPYVQKLIVSHACRVEEEVASQERLYGLDNSLDARIASAKRNFQHIMAEAAAHDRYVRRKRGPRETVTALNCFPTTGCPR